MPDFDLDELQLRSLAREHQRKRALFAWLVLSLAVGCSIMIIAAECAR